MVLKKCDCCGNEFEVKEHRVNIVKYCSDKCKYLTRKSNQKADVKTECGHCKKEMMVTKSRLKKSKSGKVFCSNECVGKHNSLVDLKNRKYKNCVICNKEYYVVPSLAEKSVTCSIECQNKWQSKYLVGKNANNYKKHISDELREHSCDWCGSKRILNPYQYKMKQVEGKKYFCTKDCYREWYAKEWSQQEEWKKECQERAVKMLGDGSFGKTDTEPQKIVNRILDNLTIKYENEYNCKSVSIDNYLTDYGLMIEVHGTYWHCDPRVYDIIEYQMQYDRIIHDRRKYANILTNYNVSILYLWEKDIIENPSLCEKLILYYINNEGVLKDYNSFNYTVVKDKLILNNNIKSYKDYDLTELHKVFIPTNKQKRSMKQLDKWIQFNCEYCGKETEQLISKHIKNKTHCCSIKCSNNMPRNPRKNK